MEERQEQREYLEAYKVLKKEARREVASGMEQVRERRQHNGILYCEAERRKNRNIIGMPCIQDKNENLKTEIGKRLEVWRGYCKILMNVENDWNG